MLLFSSSEFATAFLALSETSLILYAGPILILARMPPHAAGSRGVMSHANVGTWQERLAGTPVTYYD